MNTAEMIKRETLGDRPNQQLVGVAVRQSLRVVATSRIDLEVPVAVSVASCRPEPAAFGAILIDLFPESLFWWSGYWAATLRHADAS